MIRMFEAFAGYGSQSMAMKRLGIKFKIIGISEIDKYAIQAYMAVHGETKNYGDISLIDWKEVPDFDFFTYSFPCQDISSAGNQKGLAEGSGTRSSLLWECKKAIEAKKPKYLLMENVKALTFKKFKPYLNIWLDYLSNLGYSNHLQVLNAKNYGIPQNRERVFMISILGDESYEFPKPFELKKRLKDVLESNVDESFYLSQKILEKTILFHKQTDTGIHYEGDLNKGGQKGAILSVKGICTALTATDYKQPKQILVEPLTCAMRGRNPENPSDRTKGILTEQRVEVGGNVANCITTVQKDSLVLDPKAIGYTRDNKEKVIKRHFQNIVNTITGSTGSGGSTDCFIAEPNVLTPKRTEYGKAIRKDYEAGIHKESRHNMTEMFSRTDGISNTITTVLKDNLLLEPKIIQKYGDRGTSQYSIRDIAHTIPANPMSDRGQLLLEPQKVVVKDYFSILGISVNPISRSLEFNGLKSVKSICPALRSTDYKCPHTVWLKETLQIPQATEKGYIEVQPGGVFDGSYPDSKTRRGRVQDKGNVSPALTAQGEPPLYYEGIIYKGKILEERDGLYLGTSDPFFRGGLRNISRTIKSSNHDAAVVENYRIRKLTPRECFRLMGVSEEDIDKIQASGISKTQQYKLAGNSIVVDVLCHIYNKLFVNQTAKKNAKRKQIATQLSIFDF